MNILLTGSSGFLGKTLKSFLINNHNVFELPNSKNSRKLRLDIEIPNFEHNFDLVIHAAGKAHIHPKTLLEEKSIYDVNILGTQNLLSALSNSKLPKQFVFISSVSVYGIEFGRLIDENHPLNAKDPYGKSKILAEKIVTEWCESNNIICTILRLPLLVGTNPPGNLGSMIKAIDKGYYFNIAGGYARKSMLLVEDVSKFILKIAEIGGIYNLTDGYHPSFSELSYHISIQLNKNIPKNISYFFAKVFAEIGNLFGDNVLFDTKKLKKITCDLTFDDSKARKVFGWNPTPVLKGFIIN
jgi:nucleoside-diphosphate-sugar epimerase